MSSQSINRRAIVANAYNMNDVQEEWYGNTFLNQVFKEIENSSVFIKQLLESIKLRLNAIFIVQFVLCCQSACKAVSLIENQRWYRLLFQWFNMHAIHKTECVIFIVEPIRWGIFMLYWRIVQTTHSQNMDQVNFIFIAEESFTCWSAIRHSSVFKKMYLLHQMQTSSIF